MKLLIFNILLSVLFPLASQASTNDSISSGHRWDKREHLKYEGWKRLKPTHAKWQYAGGMGVSSLGMGWDYGKRRQWETDFLIGYLPDRYADEFRLTFTVKQNYIPWSITFADRWQIEPFYTGLYVTTIAGEEFWKREPGRYPNKYYNFSSKLRAYIFIGQRLGFDIPHSLFRNVSVFYEISSCEMYLISKVTNHSLRMKDILRISFGLKLYMFRGKD